MSDALEREIQQLKRELELSESLVFAYRGYKHIIDEMMAVQREHGLPFGGGNLPEQFRKLVAALSGKHGWDELVEQFNASSDARDQMAYRVALRRIVDKFEDSGAGQDDPLWNEIEAAREILNQTGEF